MAFKSSLEEIRKEKSCLVLIAIILDPPLKYYPLQSKKFTWHFQGCSRKEGN